MNYKSFLLSLLLCVSLTTQAKEAKDTAFSRLYHRYFELYSDTDEAAFYQASEQMITHYLKQGNTASYYKLRLNEILYDVELGKTFRAIKKADNMLQEMKQEGEKYYDIVYAAMGTIYDSRGNYRMADRYYMEAVKACEPTDTGSLVSIYPRIAKLKASREPEKAWEFNEIFGSLASNDSQYYKVYFVLKAEIAFYMNNRKIFMEAYQKHEDICKKNPMLDAYGNTLMTVLQAAFNGDYTTALALTNQESSDYSLLERYDLRIHIYDMMGDRKKALEEVDRRRDLRDSLNSNMMFESINEINTEMGLLKMEEEAMEKQEEAAKRQSMLLVAIIVLLIVALGLTVSRSFIRRRYQKELLRQNKELEIALSRAEESDRMKNSFIEHVSHEIRTPLNVITGYAQIITHPEYKLLKEDRNRMLHEISRNTTEVTRILNDLLEIAQTDSIKHYDKDDTIPVNSFCRKVMALADQENEQQLTMTFNSNVEEDFTIQCHEKVLEKVLGQLISNAIKFTKEGTVELLAMYRPEQEVVEFIVTDTGIGIAKEYHERIFDRFFKIDSFKPGFGLGLTIGRKVAKRLGGSLKLDQDYKQGARFILTIPVE